MKYVANSSKGDDNSCRFVSTTIRMTKQGGLTIGNNWSGINYSYAKRDVRHDERRIAIIWLMQCPQLGATLCYRPSLLRTVVETDRLLSCHCWSINRVDAWPWTVRTLITSTRLWTAWTGAYGPQLSNEPSPFLVINFSQPAIHISTVVSLKFCGENLVGSLSTMISVTLIWLGNTIICPISQCNTVLV